MQIYNTVHFQYFVQLSFSTNVLNNNIFVLELRSVLVSNS